MPTDAPRPSLKDLEAAEIDLRLVEQRQVIAQPHRQGSRSPLRESALGRFVEDHQCGSLCYDAGEEYRILVYKWRKASGVPQTYTIEEFSGGSGELDPDVVRDWLIRIYDCNKAMVTVGAAPYLATQALILDDLEPQAPLVPEISRCLRRLGIELGIIRDG